MGVLRLACRQNDALAALMDTAAVVGRENTGHGFYTWFETDPACPPLTDDMGLVDAPSLLVGVGPIELPMGFILWVEERRPTWLEGFQHGTEMEPVDLKAHDLFSLTILSEWD
jgi:hypothetical protein